MKTTNTNRKRIAKSLQVAGLALLMLVLGVVNSYGQTYYDCSRFQPWEPALVYPSGGDTVVYENKVYVNKWWTTGENPSQSGQWGVWKYIGDCLIGEPPAAPSALDATANGNSEATLMWTDNSTNELLFNIESSTDGINYTGVAAVEANITYFVVTGLTPSTLYYFRVNAENAAGVSPYSNVDTAVTGAPPTPPADPIALAANAVSSSQINIGWIDNSDNEDRFVIERSADGVGGWVAIATVPANTIDFENQGLQANTIYYYRVKAENAGGSSGYTNIANATTLPGGTAPAAPSALAAVAASSSQIDLSWTDNSTDEDLFRIETSADGTTWSNLATVAANTTTYSNTGLTASTLYFYRVRAENSYGNSAYSNVASDSTQAGSGGSCDGIPLYPEGRGSYVAGDQVQNIDKVYQVREWPRESWANSTSAAYEPGVGYAWEDAWTYVKDCSTTPEPPAAPTVLTATAMSDSKILLGWTDNSNNEDLFRIERSPNGTSGWTSVGTVTADVSTFSNTGLSPLTTYHYRVRAENAYGNSAYTNVASATTLDTSSADLPDRVVVGYWHNWNASSQGGYIRLVDVPSYYNVIVVAFVEKVGEDGTIRFVPDTEVVSEAQFRADVVAAQAAGKKILISIGGQNNHLILSTTAMRDNFTNSMIATIEDWGFDGLDIDLESSSMVLGPGDTDLNNPTTPGIVNLISSCRSIANHFGAGFILTAAPETAHVQGGYGSYASVYGAYLPWIHNLRDILTYVHVQYYNSGTMDGLDGGIYSVGTADFIVAMTEMLTLGFPIARDPNNMFPPLREDQVAFGVPCAPGAAGSGYTPASEVNKALDYLMTGTPFGGNYVLQGPGHYCNIRGAMTWSINWDYQDNGASYAWARDVSNKLNSIPACLKSANSIAESAESIEVGPNYPNPFDTETNITFSLEKANDVIIKVYDNLGKVVEELANERFDAGSHVVTFDGSELSTGTYYYQLIVNDKVQTGVMLKK